MLENLAQKAKDLAKEFVASKQDLFVMTTGVPTGEGEEQVTVTVKFSPKVKALTNEDIFKRLIVN